MITLTYDGKFIVQKVDEENIDLWFEQVNKRLTEIQKVDKK